MQRIFRVCSVICVLRLPSHQFFLQHMNIKVYEICNVICLIWKAYILTGIHVSCFVICLCEFRADSYKTGLHVADRALVYSFVARWLCEWREIGIYWPVISESRQLLVRVLDARHLMDKDTGLWDIYLIYNSMYPWYQQCTFIDSFIQRCSLQT
jgi:hypothetical protein